MAVSPAGKLTDIAFDDDEKRILVSARIVDDDEWRKVQEGVYTGFSQGGRYVKRWPDPESGLTRYTAEPTEISLVDLPCLPGATFEVIKDGAVEKRASPRAPNCRNPNRATQPKRSPSADSAARPPRWPRREPPAAEAPSPSAALAKAASALALAADKLERAIAENNALRKSVGALAPEVAALAARIAALESQPLPARAALRATSKRADAALADEPTFGVEEAIKRLAELSPDARAGADEIEPGAPAAAAVLTPSSRSSQILQPGAPSCSWRRCRSDWTARATNARVSALPRSPTARWTLGRDESRRSARRSP